MSWCYLCTVRLDIPQMRFASMRIILVHRTLFLENVFVITLRTSKCIQRFDRFYSFKKVL
jgi:hypothetical protein